MSIKGISNIIKKREQQYGSMIGDKVEAGVDESLDMEELKQAMSTLADNQKKIYSKLEEIYIKLGDK